MILSANTKFLCVSSGKNNVNQSDFEPAPGYLSVWAPTTKPNFQFFLGKIHKTSQVQILPKVIQQTNQKTHT